MPPNPYDCTWDQRISNEQMFNHFFQPMPQFASAPKPPIFLVARPSSTYFSGRTPDFNYHTLPAHARLLNYNADNDTQVKPYQRTVFRDTIPADKLNQVMRDKQEANHRATAAMIEQAKRIQPVWDINTSPKNGAPIC
jgi:hypothetical protein